MLLPRFYSAPEYHSTYIVLPKNVQRKSKANSKPYAFSVELYINVGQVRYLHYIILPFSPHEILAYKLSSIWTVRKIRS